MAGQRKKRSKVKNLSANAAKSVGQSSQDVENYSSGSETETEPCADCGTELSGLDLALQCDMCDHWFCNANCLKMSRQAYERIGKSKESEGIMWFCKHCRISFPRTLKILGRISHLEKKQKDLEVRISTIEKKGSEHSQAQEVDVRNTQSQSKSVKRKYFRHCWRSPV